MGIHHSKCLPTCNQLELAIGSTLLLARGIAAEEGTVEFVRYQELCCDLRR